MTTRSVGELAGRRELARAHKRGEPPAQIAARELEVDRIEHALHRGEEMAVDVADAIESAA